MLTDRLVLTPVGIEMRIAMHSSRQAFANLLGVRLPEGWPEFPQAFAVDSDSSSPPWSGYLFAGKDSCNLIGNGGFVSSPDSSGAVEIGYEIAPEYRNQGFATEAAQALMEIAHKGGARTVIAHSLPFPNASNAVMRKLGMSFVSELGARDDRVWRWQRSLRRDTAHDNQAIRRKSTASSRSSA